MDCTATTYYSTVSPLIQAVLEKTSAGTLAYSQADLDLNKLAQPLSSDLDLDVFKSNLEMVNQLNMGKPVVKPAYDGIPDDRTETTEESLSGSLLKYIDPNKASKANLEEAFCRDIDAFNEVFQVRSIFHGYSVDYKIQVRLMMLADQMHVLRFQPPLVRFFMTVEHALEAGPWRLLLAHRKG